MHRDGNRARGAGALTGLVCFTDKSQVYCEACTHDEQGDAIIDLNIPITSDYCCMKRLFFLPCGKVSRQSVSHSATSKPVLQASTPKQKSDRFFTIPEKVITETLDHK